MTDKTITVPILLDFDSERPVGMLTINKDALPPSHEFVFSVGVFVESDGQYKLECVGLVPDLKFIGYLRQIGRLPEAT